jgi:hypothetical protein
MGKRNLILKSCGILYSVLSLKGRAGVPNTFTLWGVLKVSYPPKAEGYFVVELPHSKGVCCYPTLIIASKYWKFSRATVHTANYSHKIFPWLGISEISIVKKCH